VIEMAELSDVNKDLKVKTKARTKDLATQGLYKDYTF